jgi:hypothetical protein
VGGGAPEQAAAALRVVLAEEAINFALAALFNILGLAVAWSGEYPGWLGWLWSPASARCRSAWYSSWSAGWWSWGDDVANLRVSDAASSGERHSLIERRTWPALP